MVATLGSVAIAQDVFDNTGGHGDEELEAHGVLSLRNEEEWGDSDLNRGPFGYEPTALTNCATAPKLTLLLRMYYNDDQEERMKECSNCHQVKTLDSFYRNKNRPHCYCKPCHNQKRVETFRNNKRLAVEYKGGACTSCGYNKYTGALEFHHLDPSKKDVAISRFKGVGIERLKAELDKCVLLCANCHRETHAGL